jgi:hypothetical protein
MHTVTRKLSVSFVRFSCAASSNEAKVGENQNGISFKVQPMVKSRGLKMFFFNYALYGDMSAKYDHYLNSHGNRTV